MHTKEEKIEAFARLLDVLDVLREKCPWDKKQTNKSLASNTIEEVYELYDALIEDNAKDICKELGDVLLHVCFYAKIAQEQERFDIADVCKLLVDKLIFRHPHVYHPSQIGKIDPKPLPYGNDCEKQENSEVEKVKTAKQVTQNWEQLKLKEKGGNKGVLAGVPKALPSLIKAFRIQEKAHNAGFDWKERQNVWEKVHEEINELQKELEKGDEKHSIEEMGDFFFSMINAARLYKINPDIALEEANRKFIRRFNYMETQITKSKKRLIDVSLNEMDRLWNEAKTLEE